MLCFLMNFWSFVIFQNFMKLIENQTWLQLTDQNLKNSLLLSISIFTQILCVSRMWHKVNFFVEFHRILILVFFSTGCHIKVKEPYLL